jgi:hypothetical protein
MLRKNPCLGAIPLDRPGQSVWQRLHIDNGDRDLSSNLPGLGTVVISRERGVENNTLPNDLLVFDLAYMLNPFL